MTTSLENKLRLNCRLEMEETVFIEVMSSNVQRRIILCSSIDLSYQGVQVVVDSQIDTGTIVRLCIDLLDQSPIYLLGEVKWQRKDPNGLKLGLFFFDSEETNINEWKRWVDMMIDKSAD